MCAALSSYTIKAVCTRYKNKIKCNYSCQTKPASKKSVRLILYNVDYDDQGMYRCLAGNYFGISWIDTHLEVVPRKLGVITQGQRSRSCLDSVNKWQ